MDFNNLQEGKISDFGFRLNLEPDSFAENFSVLQLVGVILIFVNTSISNSAGIGGGPITVCILMYFFNIVNIKIIALAQISIFGGSIIATLIKIKFRHPTKIKHSLIDYKLITLVIPVLMLGSSVGTLLSRIFQDWELLSMITAIAWITCGLTMKKARDMYNEENKRLKGYHHLTVNMKSDDSEQESQLFYYIVLIVSFSIMTFFSLAKGDKYFDSIFGVVMCGSVYFSMYIGYHIFLIVQTVFYGRYLLRDLEKQGSFYTELYGTKRNIAIIAMCSYITGMLAGSLGMGGGLIMNPVFLLLGVNAQVSTACCNVLVLATSITSALQFILAGYVSLYEGLGIMGVSMLGSVAGIYFVKQQVEKHQRMSIIVYILAFLLLTVGVVTPIKLYDSVVDGLQNGSFSFGVKSIC